VHPDEALALAREAAARHPGVRVALDDLGDVIVFTRRDLAHLDADALADRLHAWTLREVAPVLPGGGAFVSFRHARPATRDEATLDVQERWLDLEPTFRLHMRFPEPTEADARTFARLVPAFLRLVDAAGRPVGWRRADEGNAE
jgi:hypothetical protein